MPAVLTDRHVCATQVPMEWRELIVDLEKFLEAERQLRAADVDSTPDKTPPYISILHARLMIRSAALLEPEVLTDDPSAHDERLLVKTTLMLTRLAECVASGQEQRLDTAGSRILDRFDADFRATESNLHRLHAAVRRASTLDPQTIAEVEAEIEDDLEDANRKQKVIHAIRSHYGLWQDRPDLQAGIWRLFSDFYPDSGIAAEEVRLIATGCLIFFCLPYSATELQSERYRQATSVERQKVQRFLKRVQKFSQWQFAHFPVFGFLRGHDLPHETLADIAALSGLSLRETANEISKLTAIVPLDEVDKFVPHDVWGHSWQASMLHFDDLYRRLSTFADPLDLESSVRHIESVRCMADCFPIEDRLVRCWESGFQQFASQLVEQRLAVALSPVLAELIADVAEYNLLEVEPERRSELPNSSLLQSFPSKLDLMMQDVFFYFRQTTKAMRLWSQNAARYERTVDQLRRRGATRASAESAVQRARQAWQALEADLFAPALNWKIENNRLHVNVFTRVALNFLGLHRAILETYRRVSDQDVGELPLRSFRDLLLMGTAIFFEADPTRNLWRVDEFVTLRIVPWCERLAAAVALDRSTGRGGAP